MMKSHGQLLKLLAKNTETQLQTQYQQDAAKSLKASHNIACLKDPADHHYDPGDRQQAPGHQLPLAPLRFSWVWSSTICPGPSQRDHHDR
jgi:hypothetical protein